MGKVKKAVVFGIERDIKDIKLVYHGEYDADGNKVLKPYVKVTVVIKKAVFPVFVPLDIFKKENPEIDI